MKTWGEYIKATEAEQVAHMRGLVDYWAKLAVMLDADDYAKDEIEEQQNNGERAL